MRTNGRTRRGRSRQVGGFTRVPARGATAATTVVFITLAFGALGCESPPAEAGADDRSADAAPVVRDSAGIHIVENREHAPDSTGWWIDTVPSLMIGDDETRAEEYLFGWVSDARRLPDGRLVVADAQTGDVRLFDASGEFIRRIGRQGDGPGEYRRPGQLFLFGDTIVVRSGYMHNPAPFFTADGEFVRDWRPSPGSDPLTDGPLGIFADGSVLAEVNLPMGRIEDAGEPLTPLVFDHSARMVRVNDQGGVLAEFGERVVARRVRYYRLQPSPFPQLSDWVSQSFDDGSAELYLPQPVTTVRGMELYRTEGGPFEIVVFDEEARLRRIIRKRHTPVPIPRAWADSVWNRAVDLSSESEVWEVLARAEPPAVPEHAPAIDRLLFDDLKNLWVRSSPVGHPEPPTWFVFDGTGVLTHSLTTELDPVQIGDDFVLAVPRDELGVSRVALFPLHKEHRR